MRLYFCSLAAAAVFCSSFAASAQSAIPIKTGLWETSSTSSMTGFKLPPEMQARIAQLPPDQQARLRALGDGTPHTTKSQSCLTKADMDEWTKIFQKKSDDNDCKYSNVVQTPSQWSFDITCSNSSGHSSNGHFVMNIDSPEQGHGTMHMVTTGATSQPVTVDASFNSHYLGADCGSVKPGTPQPVQ